MAAEKKKLAISSLFSFLPGWPSALSNRFRQNNNRKLNIENLARPQVLDLSADVIFLWFFRDEMECFLN